MEAVMLWGHMMQPDATSNIQFGHFGDSGVSVWLLQKLLRSGKWWLIFSSMLKR
jgi:hypothetical protein